MTMIKTKDLLDNLYMGSYGDQLNDYRNSNTYICDAIMEIADINTSVVSSDILDFIGNNPQALADVINEGLYDPTHDYNLYRHGQTAECMTIESELYENISDSIYCTAINFVLYDLQLDKISEELADSIREWADNTDNNDRMSDICDKICEYLDIE